MSNLEKTVHT